MKNITRLFLGNCTLFLLTSCHSVMAIEINGETYCKLTIGESESSYIIIVPQEKVDFFRELPDFEIVGINCRNEQHK